MVKSPRKHFKGQNSSEQPDSGVVEGEHCWHCSPKYS